MTPAASAALRILRSLALGVYLAFAPSTVPPWRGDPSHRAVAVLPVGDVTPPLTERGSGPGSPPGG